MVQKMRPARRRTYTTGNPEPDARIVELDTSARPAANAALVQEMIIPAFRLVRDKAERGEMKLINAAIKEFAYAFQVFSKWREYRKVSIFGSARTAPGEPVYAYTR